MITDNRRGSGRTTKILTQMAETIIQSYGNCPWDRVYFFSPNRRHSELCGRMFDNIMFEFGYSYFYARYDPRNKILHNGTRIHFREALRPIDQEMYMRNEEWRGISGDYLIFEDHTLYELSNGRVNYEQHPQLQQYFPKEFKDMYLGEWDGY
jgi:hypothetical protein